MSVERPPSSWSTDYTVLCERFAERLRLQGCAHPVAAAVAQAARGHRGVDQQRWAAQLALAPSVVADAEIGLIPFDQLPVAIRSAADAIATLDLDRLAPS